MREALAAFLSWIPNRLRSVAFVIFWLDTKHRQSAAITRQLRLLQAHELIKKQANSHRYHLTEEGQRAITALLAACRANAAKLMETAA
jgi:DNA-binding HxlR family transcriptional regulator